LVFDKKNRAKVVEISLETLNKAKKLSSAPTQAFRWGCVGVGGGNKKWSSKIRFFQEVVEIAEM
jgi:hypothetical protein